MTNLARWPGWRRRRNVGPRRPFSPPGPAPWQTPGRCLCLVAAAAGVAAAAMPLLAPVSVPKTQNEEHSVVMGCASRCIAGREAAAAQQQHSSSSSSNSGQTPGQGKRYRDKTCKHQLARTSSDTQKGDCYSRDIPWLFSPTDRRKHCDCTKH